MAHLSEATVRGRRAPDDEASRLYAEYQSKIFRYCLGQLRSREEAEDAVQNTFLRVTTALRKGVVPEFEAPWVYKIAHNVCLSKRLGSTRRARVETPADLDTLGDRAAAYTPDADELFGLDDALTDMPPNLRRPLLMREWQGMSYAEIADALGVSHSAVETLIFRARRHLAQSLTDSFKKGSRAIASIFNLRWLFNALKGLGGGLGGAGLAGGTAALVVAIGGGVAIDLAIQSASASHVHRSGAPKAAVAVSADQAGAARAGAAGVSGAATSSATTGRAGRSHATRNGAHGSGTGSSSTTSSGASAAAGASSGAPGPASSRGGSSSRGAGSSGSGPSSGGKHAPPAAPKPPSPPAPPILPSFPPVNTPPVPPVSVPPLAPPTLPPPPVSAPPVPPIPPVPSPPTIAVPGNLVAEATGPLGAAVTYTVTATDAVDGTDPVTCSSASGSTFRLGHTTVSCSATDKAGNASTASFDVLVRDTTPPSLSVPSGITVKASLASGVNVTYTATAADLVDPAPAVSCSPASGSLLLVGKTTVTCTATDAAGNSSSKKFDVTVTL